MTPETQQLACLSLHAYSMCVFLLSVGEMLVNGPRIMQTQYSERNLGRLKHWQHCIQSALKFLEKATGLRRI